jgi:hypothetical protein
MISYIWSAPNEEDFGELVDVRDPREQVFSEDKLT